MKTIVLPEYGRLRRAELGTRLERRLFRFDHDHARRTGSCVFDWSLRDEIRASNLVGIVQVAGLTVEVLPKIDADPNVGEADYQANKPLGERAQNNLLYMLSLTQRVPVHPRDIASQRVRQWSLLETLIAIFVNKLLFELRRGRDRAYVYKEENLHCVRGRLLVNHQVRVNHCRRDRLFMGYDEFTDDTLINRIFKAACRRLLSLTHINRTQQGLREAMIELCDVADVVIRADDFNSISLDRDSQRFAVLIEFACLVLSDTPPAVSTGSTETFSLLFPMDQLFEEFIGRFLYRYAPYFGLERSAIHLQARHCQRHLLRDEDGKRRFRMRPDIVVYGEDSHPSVIVDTKWKRLRKHVEDPRNGVAQADLYQMYAYGNRYDCDENVLLYPRVDGVTAKQYRFEGVDEHRRLRVEFVDMNVDLVTQSLIFKAGLRSALSGVREAKKQAF